MNKTTYIWEFIKIFDEWNKIETFCQEITGSKAQFVDADGKFIIGQKNLLPFCQYVYKSAFGALHCHECYQNNCFTPDVIKNGFNIFQCHAGLTNISIPVYLNNEIIGAILGGGMLTKESDLRNSYLYAKKIKLDNDFIDKINQVKYISPANIENIATILKNITHEFRDLLISYYKQLEVIHKFFSESTFNIIPNKEDKLTGLFEQEFFHTRLKEEIERSSRYNLPLCILMVGIDNLKKINELYGHESGDIVIKNIVKLLKINLRKIDSLYRYKGNTFAILASNTHVHHATKLAERIKKIIAKKQEMFEPGQENFNVSISIGIAPYTIHSSSVSILTEDALNALEHAHNANAGTIRIHELASVKSDKRRVVITGIGVVSPIGIGKENFISNLKAGKSGISKISLFDASNFTSRIAGEVKDLNMNQYMSQKVIDRTCRSSQFAIAASKMAIYDAGLTDLFNYDTNRISVIIGSGVAGLEYGEEQIESYVKQGVRKVSPYLSVIVFAGIISSEVSIELGVKGKSITISTGCTSSADAIGHALHEIQRGDSDIIVTGGTEAPLRPTILASFCTLKAVSTFNDIPEKASRPFDKKRDGFVLSEGSGILVLEELQHALRRGAHIYGEIIGYGATDDAFHRTQPAPNGDSAAKAICNALSMAQVSIEEIDYINSHGSATPLNDSTETMVIKNVFRKNAYKIPVSSTKSMEGHPLGASGAIELIASVLGMEYKFLPPTINYEDPDPFCDLEDYVTTGARTKEINTFISNSFGFGGKNACLVVRKYI